MVQIRILRADKARDRRETVEKHFLSRLKPRPTKLYGDSSRNAPMDLGMSEALLKSKSRPLAAVLGIFTVAACRSRQDDTTKDEKPQIREGRDSALQSQRQRQRQRTKTKAIRHST
jgi:hypothetical protein